ncbi:MAG TPA: hypothetical protein VG347_15135 [Verrucomicrobiae bacterium]|nr:hypothetical protein [Verrucomicrobiae bacterium]
MKTPAIILFALCALFVSAQPLPPPPVTSTNTALKLIVNPPHLRIITNCELTWDAYTNVYFEVRGSTNLGSWYHVTNVPVWKTNVVIPVIRSQEFFKIVTHTN